MTQTLQKETPMDRLVRDYIALFIPMEWNYEGYIDSYGLPVFETPKKPVKDLMDSQLKSVLLNTGKMK